MALLNPYLSFRGNAREALEFYKSVFGGELTVSTYGEFQMPGIGEEEADKIMHGQLTTPAGFTLMGADTPSGMPYDDSSGGITLSVSGTDEVELRGYWDGLADGGEVTMPLEKAPWGDAFGQLNDRYGTPWMFNIGGSPEA
jgi:PhnB protein